MKTKEDFMMYFNRYVFTQMNTIYGVNPIYHISNEKYKKFYDAFIFMNRVYHNIEEFKNDTEADIYVKHIIRYLKEYMQSMYPKNNSDEYDKYAGIKEAIEEIAKEGGFLNE